MDKAPGSGGPAAGKPEGVKSGEKLLEEVKAQVQSGQAPPEQVAPAEATIRSTAPDGSADASKETTASTKAGARENLAQEEQKLGEQAKASAEVKTAEDTTAQREGDEAARRIGEDAKNRRLNDRR